MFGMSRQQRTCDRGHKFQKSSDCPICPVCWSVYYKDKNRGDFPKGIGAPALRALLNAKITSIDKIAKYTEKEILQLHGMGPKTIPLLKSALKKKGLDFKK